MKGLKVLELGSGTGFVGLVASALGCVDSYFAYNWMLNDTLFYFLRSGDCLMTDLPEMIPLMKRNLYKNAPLVQGTISAKAFEWGSDISSLVAHSDKSFDIVLAADCLYYRKVLIYNYCYILDC